MPPPETKIIATAKRRQRDVAVFDIDLPGIDGLTTASDAADALPGTRTLIVTSLGHPWHTSASPRARVDGFILKDALLKINGRNRVDAIRVAGEAGSDRRGPSSESASTDVHPRLWGGLVTCADPRGWLDPRRGNGHIRPLREGAEHRGQGGDVLIARLSRNYDKGAHTEPHMGGFPCLRTGSGWCLARSTARERASTSRVVEGSMMSSTRPRSAA